MRTHPLPASSYRARLAVAAAALTAGTLTGCLRNPSADAATAQALTEIAEQLGALQQDNAELQQQVDSLRAVLARQDTVVRRLANLAGVPIAP
jgi:septal ring factor EnvC (AmiA/AmiB activator)